MIRSICPKWHELGRLLGMGAAELSAISLKNQKDPEPCCTDVVAKWLEDGSPHYPLTWGGVFELLDDLDETTLATELKNALGGGAFELLEDLDETIFATELCT